LIPKEQADLDSDDDSDSEGSEEDAGCVNEAVESVSGRPMQMTDELVQAQLKHLKMVQDLSLLCPDGEYVQNTLMEFAGKEGRCEACIGAVRKAATEAAHEARERTL
jgi:hypothetical protein